jgi:hypothetical protein
MTQEEYRPKTFWELTEYAEVVIPIIQRDYAQGRRTNKIDDIRNNFLSKLLETISNREKSIELDFIYGSFDIENKIFTPLDGQQRLTTLFLLHWYLAKKEGFLHDHSKQLLKFTYEVRPSSSMFCKKLVEDTNIVIRSDEELVPIIENQWWYFRRWKNDPTVQSMLVMLEAIHEKFKDQPPLFNFLIDPENPPITFKYVALNDYKLTDSLYIKMNARGKALTNFENFKANFEQKLEDDFLSLKNEFIEKADKEWLDFFWKLEEESKVADNEYLRFFKEMFICFLGENRSSSKTNNKEQKYQNFINSQLNKKESISYEDWVKDYLKKYDAFIANLTNGDKYIPFSQYEEYGIFTEGNLTRLFKLIDFFVDYKSQNTEPIEMLREFVNAKKTTYPKRLKFYAILHFILSGNDLDSKAYNDWMRFIENLAQNTDVDSPERLSNAIQAVRNFSALALSDIYTYIQKSFTTEDLFITETSFFDEYQRREEWVKIQLIQESRTTQNNNWEEAIYQAEQHPYFKCQIRFLLDYSKQNDGTYCIQTFKKYYQKAVKIFDSNNGLVANDDYLFSRALFTFGSYEHENSWRYRSFYNQRNRDSWRKLLATAEKSKLVKALFDQVNIDNIPESLQIIIDNFNDKDNWLYPVIKCSELIKRPGRINLEHNMIRLLDSHGLTEHCKAINPFLYTLHRELIKQDTIKSEEIIGLKGNNWMPSLIITLEDKTILEISSKHSFCKHSWYYVIKYNNSILLNEQIATIQNMKEFLASTDRIKQSITKALQENAVEQS